MKISRIYVRYVCLTITILACLTLIGCNGQTEKKESTQQTTHQHQKTSTHSHTNPQHTHEGHEGHEGHESMKTLPVEKRVAFMSGHVEAGLALYRAGAPDQAAKHLLHPVSETHKDERAGIDALGFTPDTFKAVSKALDEGKPASEIEPMLKAAEENIALMQKNAGGSPADLIEYLMETVNEEYAVGVKNGAITDPGEYQDAFGFSVVALDIAQRMKGETNKEIVEHLKALLALWPKGGPLAKSTPKPVASITTQTAKVIKSLATIR